MFNKCEITLTILFILYLVIGTDDNLKMAQIVDIPQMKAVIIILSLLLFVYCNKILGILGIFVAYEILHFSHVMINENIAVEEILFPEHNLEPIIGLNSIEEEMVFKGMPSSRMNLNKCSYQPFTTYLF